MILVLCGGCMVCIIMFCVWISGRFCLCSFVSMVNSRLFFMVEVLCGLCV